MLDTLPGWNRFRSVHFISSRSRNQLSNDYTMIGKNSAVQPTKAETQTPSEVNGVNKYWYIFTLPLSSYEGPTT